MKNLTVDDERDVKTIFRQKFRKEIKSNELQLDFAFSGNDAMEILCKKSLRSCLWFFRY